MTMVESLQQALAGMQNIEREIIAQVRGRGGAIEASQFSWNHGRLLAELRRDVVHMEVRTKSKRVSAEWSRAHLEDSWERIDRFEVHQGIERIAEEIAPRLIHPARSSIK